MGQTILHGIRIGKCEAGNEYPPGIYHKVNSGLNRPMRDEDISDIRRRNLKALATAAGSNARLANAIDRAPALVNNLLSDRLKKPMGEKLARHIEQRLGLERGAMDDEDLDLWESRRVAPGNDDTTGVEVTNEPQDFPVRGGAIAVDRLDVRASMGPGVPMPERETVIDSMRVPLEWVREQFPYATSPQNLKIITGFGDSMLPTYKHGDPLIVDTGVSAMDVDTVYVFSYQNELYVKRIQRLPDKSIKVISDNRALYEPFTLTADQRADVNVIARVICAVNMNKLA